MGVLKIPRQFITRHLKREETALDVSLRDCSSPKLCNYHKRGERRFINKIPNTNYIPVMFSFQANKVLR
jgi:hypothetical protein